MCGIFGMVSQHGVDPDLLWFGTHSVRHRGPDDWGFVSLAPFEKCTERWRYWRRWKERQHAREYGIGLGSRRLSILDLSEAGRQPMNLRGTELWIIWNGEIYNYRELRAELAADHCFTTESDTEVLLAAYEKWGSECLGRLNGMFALAIWDGRRERVFLARDRFGEKPLYYAHYNGRFVFASELKQFLEDSEFEREVDRSALADFLLLSLQDHDERTFYAHVKQLRAGHWMEIDIRGGVRGPYRYWMPEITDDLDASRDKWFGEELPFLLRDSIRLRLRSDVRVGICLSGGLDSTAICSLAAAQVSDPASLAAYTMSFPGYSEDELSSAEEVAKRAGVQHAHSTFRAHDLWERLHAFVHSQDGPTGGASTFASSRVFEMAREDGTIVLLNGQGGDELFAGYDKFYFMWLRQLIARGRWLRFAASAGSYFRENGVNRWNLAQGRRYVGPFLRNRMMGMWQFSVPEMRNQTAETIDLGGSEGLNRRLWRDISEFSLPCLLHWEDRNSMAAGTEARLPFLDHRLVEAVLSTSARTKLKNGFTKYSLRCAMDGLLPAEICWQKKKRGFETPARQWFKTDLAPQIEELLSQRGSPLSEFFEMDRLLAQFKVYEKGSSGSLTENEWFKLVGTSIWLEQLKSSSRRPVPEAALAVQ